VVATVAPSGATPAPGKPEGSEDKKPAPARLVVVGTADFASNQFLNAQGNRDFFLNVVSWLAEQEDMISIRPKETKQSPVVLTSAQSGIVLWLPLAVLPGAVLFCGIVVVLQRRRLK
jgi:gliding motility-associatede transport system auxiliary component